MIWYELCRHVYARQPTGGVVCSYKHRKLCKNRTHRKNANSCNWETQLWWYFRDYYVPNFVEAFCTMDSHFFLGKRFKYNNFPNEYFTFDCFPTIKEGNCQKMCLFRYCHHCDGLDYIYIRSLLLVQISNESLNSILWSKLGCRNRIMVRNWISYKLYCERNSFNIVQFISWDYLFSFRVRTGSFLDFSVGRACQWRCAMTFDLSFKWISRDPSKCQHNFVSSQYWNSRRNGKMFTLWTLIEASMLCLNAICILHEERFLAKGKFHLFRYTWRL